MKRFWRVFWRMGRVYFFYPAMIAIMIWIDYKNYHWIFGVGVIAAILILDPLWARLGRNSIRMWRNRKKQP